jgi:phosphoesterase RecJ-like protein
MELQPFQQVEQLLKEKQRILLLTHVKMDGDALGSIISTYLFLQKMGKDVTAVCGDPVPDALKFLPITNVVDTEFNGVRDYIVTIDCNNGVVDKLKYAVEDNKVNIIITPKKGAFEDKDISFRRGDAKYDLVIVLDTPDLGQLGSIYQNNADLFYDIPVINIDHHPSNTRFGHVHVIDPIASSACEILFDMFRYLQKKQQFVDQDIATLLLAGIITDTGSFQNANTTPKSLDIAADLLDLGADQQDIIRHVYKTKNLTTLKLWGKVLSKLQVDDEHRIVWSTISASDLKETRANMNEAGNIIDELMTNAPGAEIILLFREEEDHVSCSMRTTDPNVNASKIASIYGGGGHRQAAGFKIRENKSFEHIVSSVIEKLRTYQNDRFGNISIETTNLKEGALTDRQSRVLEMQQIHPKNGVSPVKPLKVNQADSKNSTQPKKQPQPPRDSRHHFQHKNQEKSQNRSHSSNKSVDVIQKLTEKSKKTQNTNNQQPPKQPPQTNLPTSSPQASQK